MKIFSRQGLITLLFLAGLFFITTANIVAYQEARRMLVANNWVNHTHVVIETANKTLLSMLETRSDVIHSVIANYKLPLANYQRMVSTVSNNLQEVRQLTLDNPIQQHKIDKLEPLIKQKLDLLQQVLSVYSRKNQRAALELLAEAKQQTQKTEITQIFAALIQDEQELLNKRIMIFNQDIHKSNFLFILSTILCDCMLGLSLILLFYYLKERTRAENNTAESEERLQIILDNTQDYSIIMLNPKGIVITWSIGAERVNGYKAEEIIGQYFSCFYPQEAIDIQRPRHDLQRAKNTGSTEDEGWRVRKDGSTFWANVIITALHDQNGHFIGYSKITRDLTEHKKIEQLKDEFISVVSHELRTPLTSIRGSLGLILGGAVGEFTEKAKQLLSIANMNCERLLILINDILDMEKIESGKIDFKFNIVDINQLVNESIIANKISGETLGITFLLDQTVQDLKVNVDPARLMQVLTNLISNSVKFSARGAQIRLSITQHHEIVRVSVNNTGAEIPEEFQPRIFQRFAQADSSDTRGNSGTGLGLYISKSIIEKLGGTLKFTSHPEKGTTFYFDLPIWNVKSVVTQISDQIVPNKNKLLICEDDEDQAKYLALLLESSGFYSDISLTVGQAKQFLTENEYTALLLDLILPDQDGISFIRELRGIKKTQDLPIIVISIFAESGRSLLNGDAFTVIDWLTKPIDFNRLLHVVMRIKKEMSPRIPRILHVEDDIDAQRIIATLLEDYSEVVSVATLHETRDIIKKNDFDLVILDLLLPDGDGKEILPRLAKLKLPIIIFSSVDFDPSYSKYVNQVLVKAKTSKEQLLTTITNLLKLNKPGE